MDRMFARIIGMEEKLDDLEDEVRKLRSELSASRRPLPSRSRSARASASAHDRRRRRTGLTASAHRG